MLAEGATPIVPVRQGQDPTGCRRTGSRPQPHRTSPGEGRNSLSEYRCDAGRPRCPDRIRHFRDALVPVGHGNRDAVGLGGRSEVLFRPALGQVKRELQHPVHADRLITVSWITTSRSVPGTCPRSTIFALGILAHDVEVDVAGRAVGQRRGHPRAAAPDANSHTGRTRGGISAAIPRRDMVGNSGQPTAPKNSASCLPAVPSSLPASCRHVRRNSHGWRN